MKCFAHIQSTGKMRPIDDGRSCGHNALCFAAETIFTSSPDAVVAGAKVLHTMRASEADEIPDWAGLAFGSEDMASAYRQIPNRPDEEAGRIVAWFDLQDAAVRFAISHAHPSGLGTAVLNFNRLPALTSAFARRAFGAAVTHYF